MDLQLATHEITPTVRGHAEGIFAEAELADLYGKIAKHPQLGGADAARVEEAVSEALRRHRAGYAVLPQAEHATYRNSFVRDALPAVEKAFAHDEAVIKAIDAGKPLTTINPLERPSLQNYTAPELQERSSAGRPPITRLSKEQKFWGGMSLVMAVLTAIGTLQSAKQVVQEDEQGKKHIQATPLMLTILQGALTAGMAYSGYKALQPIAR